MGMIVNLILRVTDLLEAEGRVARVAAQEIAIGCAFLAAACALGVLASTAAAAALVVALWTVMPPAGALAIVAVMLGLATWAVASLAMRTMETVRRVRPSQRP